MFTRGVVLFLLGFGMWFMNQVENPRGGMALFIALALIGAGFIGVGAAMVWASRSGKIAMRERILDSIEWRGDEKILDVGCGRGLMLVGAAKRLKTGVGKAGGVDNWSAEHLSGNSAESAMANAKAEGVADRVKVENSDPRRVPYPASSYDVVMSGLFIHNFAEEGDRAKVLDEMLRVVKPGGQILIWDLFAYGDYIRHFEKAGVQIVKKSGMSLLWCVPGAWFLARKK